MHLIGMDTSNTKLLGAVWYSISTNEMIRYLNSAVNCA